MASTKDGVLTWWWLRSPGVKPTTAANIGDYGVINYAGHKVLEKKTGKGGIRPVITVKAK
ncbi:MAG: hypothetical protein K6D02_08820 [Lachnospiraceae bacterium]|nr:hypothetical protein [Lachnospiraceae bacterium]